MRLLDYHGMLRVIDDPEKMSFLPQTPETLANTLDTTNSTPIPGPASAPRTKKTGFQRFWVFAAMAPIIPKVSGRSIGVLMWSRSRIRSNGAWGSIDNKPS